MRSCLSDPNCPYALPRICGGVAFILLAACAPAFGAIWYVDVDTPAAEIDQNGETWPTAYATVQGGYDGTGNLAFDPRFRDPANLDFHLLWGSPCIDTGTDLGAPAFDADNTFRPVDMPGLGADGTGTEYAWCIRLLWSASVFQ